MRSPLIFASVCLALVAKHTYPVQAKDYPERPVKVIVPYPPGGAVDVMARIVAQKLSEGLGGQFYVENISGAGGDNGTRVAATAPADGQTILVVSPDFVIRPLVKANVPYDPISSFAPITLLATSPAMISVSSSVQAKTMKELIDLLKASPGTLSERRAMVRRRTWKASGCIGKPLEWTLSTYRSRDSARPSHRPLQATPPF
jgi:tripartite-type tricarboxylate transporter receptor subunit TctC